MSKKNKVANHESKPMSEKLNHDIATDKTDRESIVSKVMGIGLVVIAIALVLLAVWAVFASKAKPKIDDKLPVPTIESIDSPTNSRNIGIKGAVSDGVKRVSVYANGKESGIAAVKEGDFSYDFEPEKEGTYKFEASSLKGFPFKKRSVRSNIVKVVVDWTKPSDNVSFDVKDVVPVGKIDIPGKAEANTSVTIISTVSNRPITWKAEANDKGEFVLKDVNINKGDNSFKVEVKDRAGNTTKVSDPLKIKGDGGEIGGGVHDTQPDLPVAAGDLFGAKNSMFAEKLMIGFGVVALLVLAVNSTLVVKKLRSR